MMHVVESFVRDQFGSWLCIKPVEMAVGGTKVRVAPGTRFSRGTSISDVDLAGFLDEVFETLQ
jgi:hypothetical protein